MSRPNPNAVPISDGLGRSLEDRHLLIVAEAETLGALDIVIRVNVAWSDHESILSNLAKELEARRQEPSRETANV